MQTVVLELFHFCVVVLVGGFLFLLVILLIHLVSYDFTQKMQKTWHMNFGSEYIYMRFWSLIILMTIIVSICLMWAASTISVSSNIRMTTGMSGLVLTLLWGLLLVVGGVIVRKTEEKQSYKHVFVQGVENEDHDSYKKSSETPVRKIWNCRFNWRKTLWLLILFYTLCPIIL